MMACVHGMQVMMNTEEEDLRSYFEELTPFVLRLQEPEGSFRNQVGPGPAFGTAAAVLILTLPERCLVTLGG